MNLFTTGPGSRRQLWWSFLALALLTGLLYANTLDNGFVLDDTSYIQENLLLRDLSNLPEFFDVPEDALVEDLPPGLLRGRNLRWVTYALDWAVGGGNPWAFHLSNMVWHFFAATALLLFIRMLSGSLLLGWLTAALFTAHPVQTSAVAYISGRKDILASFFLLAAFLLVFRHRSRKRTWLLGAGALSFVLAYFGKEVAAVFPLLLVWADVCRSMGALTATAVADLFRCRWKEYLLFSALAAFLVVRQLGPEKFLAFLSPAEAAAAVAPAAAAGLQPNLSFANVMAFYVQKLAWPFPLLADYRGVFDFSLYPPSWGAWISPLAALAFLAFCVWLRRRWAMGAFGLGWVAISLLPVSHLLDFHTPVAEHYLYLPCAGFSLAVASGIMALSRRAGHRWIGAALIPLLFGYAAATVARNGDWQNMETLTLDILAKAPHHPRARSTLVHLYAEKGELDKALNLAREDVRRHPASPISRYNLAVLLDDRGLVDEAVFQYRMAIRLDPRLWDAYLNLGNLLLSAEREREGRQVLEELNRRYAYQPLSHWILGNHEARKGHWEQALLHYRRAVATDPREPAGHLGIAGALWVLGQEKAARQALERALDLGLDVGWISRQPPWNEFFQRPDVKAFLQESGMSGA